MNSYCQQAARFKVVAKRVAAVVLGCFPIGRMEQAFCHHPVFSHEINTHEQKSCFLAKTGLHLDGGMKSAWK